MELSKTINTLKRRKLIKAIPEANSLKEAAIKAGYKLENGSKSIYREGTRRHLEKAFEAMGYDETSIKADFKRLQALAEQRHDLSNANRSLENISRISGLFKDKQELSIDNKLSPAIDKQELAKNMKAELDKLEDKS